MKSNGRQWTHASMACAALCCALFALACTVQAAAADEVPSAAKFPSSLPVIDSQRWQTLASSTDPDVHQGVVAERLQPNASGFAKAARAYARAAARGVAAGQYALGDCYWNARGVQRDYHLAAKWWSRAAQQGYPRAIASYSSVFQLGRGAEPDPVKAIPLMLKAARAGDALGEYLLGATYGSGNGIVEDDRQSVFWLRKAAAAGHPWAQQYLGNRYETGRGVRADPHKAFELYRQSASAGFADAMENVASLYQRGFGVRADATLADRWNKARYETLLRGALDADPYSEGQLGYAYKFGTGVTQDTRKSLEWFEKAAENGDATAEMSLAAAYQTGIGREKSGSLAMRWYGLVEQQSKSNGAWVVGFCYQYCPGMVDPLKARQWYETGARFGNVGALTALGELYAGGLGTPKDLKRAAENFRRAADRGSAYGAYELGELYGATWGGKADYALARKEYERAAALGDTNACIALGNIYIDGDGVKQDYRKVAYWYGRAAATGSVEGKIGLAWRYVYGQGVTKDVEHGLDLLKEASRAGSQRADYYLGDYYDEERSDIASALPWYLRAGGSGNREAAQRLGFVYARGWHVAQDRTAATKWFAIAYGLGDDTAKRPLAALRKVLSLDQKQAAAVAIAQWAADNRVALSTLEIDALIGGAKTRDISLRAAPGSQGPRAAKEGINT